MIRAVGAAAWKRWLCFAFLGLAGTGCGDDDPYAELGLIPVTGRVTLDGRPLAGAKVSFDGADKRSAIGVTAAGGRYELMYDSQTPGALPGHKTVRITLADANVEGADPSAASQVEGAVAERIPARYNRHSQLTAEVSASQRAFNFELRSAP